jgi:leader peptidase (prepilin peptidase)/N-methyltransferase
VKWPKEAKIIFAETSVHLPDREIPYDELFYRKTDVIVAKAKRVEMIDRSYFDAVIRLSQFSLKIDQDKFETEELDPENVHHFEVVGSEIILPREAMGLGDVKFMAALGAFLGWPAVVFALAFSSILGSLAGLALIVLRRRDWSARLPYGPYIAVAAVVWIFGGYKWVRGLP